MSILQLHVLWHKDGKCQDSKHQVEKQVLVLKQWVQNCFIFPSALSLIKLLLACSVGLFPSIFFHVLITHFRSNSVFLKKKVCYTMLLVTFPTFFPTTLFISVHLLFQNLIPNPKLCLLHEEKQKLLSLMCQSCSCSLVTASEESQPATSWRTTDGNLPATGDWDGSGTLPSPGLQDPLKKPPHYWVSTRVCCYPERETRFLLLCCIQ